MKRALVLAGLIALGFTVAANEVVAKDGRAEGKGQGPRISFSELDSDGDGKITVEELQARQVARLAEADANSDGFLSAEELAAQMQGREAERAEKRIGRMIERLDSDGDGQLSLEEAQARNDGRHMIDRLDADKDGAVSEAEFAEARGMRGQGKGGPGGKERGAPKSE